MAVSITINNLNINSGNYKVNTIAHDSAPPLRAQTLEIARRDGEELVSANFGPKRIEINGVIKTTSEDTLVDAIDTLKKYCLESDLIDLDVQYGAATRRYEVEVMNVIVTRESYAVTFAPFTIVCEALEEPMGRALEWSAVWSADNLTQEYHQFTPYFGGTARPLPKITFMIEDAASLEGIHVYCRNTNTRLETYTVFTSGDELKIDTDDKAVLLNEEPFSFEGIFPEFDVGSNVLEVNFQTGSTIAIEQNLKNRYFPVYRKTRVAQCFKPTANLSCPKIEVYMRHNTRRKTAAEDPVKLRIETDSGQEPSGNLVNVNSVKEIAIDNITDNKWYWFRFDFPGAVPLTSGTRYWIVLREMYTRRNRCLYEVGLRLANPYTGSGLAHDTLYSWDNGVRWKWKYKGNKRGKFDMVFRVYDQVTTGWIVDFNMDYKKRYY